MWKKNKGNAVAFVLMFPYAIFQPRRPETFVQKYNRIFIESNKKLRKMLPKAEKRSEKMFITSIIELNTIGIEINPLLLDESKKLDEVKKLKSVFFQNSTTENLLSLWTAIKDFMALEMRIAELLSRKADIQDKVIKYDREMTSFDKKDIEDFWRAILADLAISYYEQKAMIVGTPIELLLKSSKIMNRIRKVFLLSEVLRENVRTRKKSQDKLIKWFLAYEGKA